MADGFGLGKLTDLIGFGVEQYVRVQGAEQQYEIEEQRLKYQTAQEEKAAAQAAAQASANFINSGLVKNVVFWTLTAIAGGVLTAVVLKAAGFR